MFVFSSHVIKIYVVKIYVEEIGVTKHSFGIFYCIFKDYASVRGVLALVSCSLFSTVFLTKFVKN